MQSRSFIVEGQGFDAWPDNIIGVMSNKNDDPRHWLGTQLDERLAEVVERFDTRIVFTSRAEEFDYGSSGYLGVIATLDQSMVVWENDSQPLPEMGV